MYDIYKDVIKTLITATKWREHAIKVRSVAASVVGQFVKQSASLLNNRYAKLINR